MVQPRKNPCSVFDGLDPVMTLEEVGALLGISDNCVMRTERSAVDRLRRLATATGASSVRDFLRKEDADLKKVMALRQNHCCEYSMKQSWFALTKAHSVNGGTTCIRDAILAYNLLCMGRPSRLKVPLYALSPADGDHSQIGSVDSFAMVGNNGMFWSRSFKGWQRRHHENAAAAIAILESESGQDDEGTFEIPIITAVIAGLPAEFLAAVERGE
jgi:hypothetical protein